MGLFFGNVLAQQGQQQQQGQQGQQVQEIEELDLEINASWQANQPYVQTFPTGDYIPVFGSVNRDAYIYLFVIYPNDFVSLDYPRNYDPTTEDNVVWASLDKSFARFIPTADYDGLWTFVMIASLEPLTPEELAAIKTPPDLVVPIFSTPYVDVEVRQARVSEGSMVSQLAKESSFLWGYFQYVRENDLFE